VRTFVRLKNLVLTRFLGAPGAGVRTSVRCLPGFKKLRVMVLDYFQVLLHYLFTPASEMADFGYIHTPAHKKSYPLVIFNVPVYGFLTVVNLESNIRRSNFLFVQLKDYSFMGDSRTHVRSSGTGYLSY